MFSVLPPKTKLHQQSWKKFMVLAIYFLVYNDNLMNMNIYQPSIPPYVARTQNKEINISNPDKATTTTNMPSITLAPGTQRSHAHFCIRNEPGAGEGGHVLKQS